jgi:hypothetical protein
MPRKVIVFAAVRVQFGRDHGDARPNGLARRHVSKILEPVEAVDFERQAELTISVQACLRRHELLDHWIQRLAMLAAQHLSGVGRR